LDLSLGKKVLPEEGLFLLIAKRVWTDLELEKMVERLQESIDDTADGTSETIGSVIVEVPQWRTEAKRVLGEEATQDPPNYKRSDRNGVLSRKLDQAKDEKARREWLEKHHNILDDLVSNAQLEGGGTTSDELREAIRTATQRADPSTHNLPASDAIVTKAESKCQELKAAEGVINELKDLISTINGTGAEDFNYDEKIASLTTKLTDANEKATGQQPFKEAAENCLRQLQSEQDDIKEAMAKTAKARPTAFAQIVDKQSDRLKYALACKAASMLLNAIGADEPDCVEACQCIEVLNQFPPNQRCFQGHAFALTKLLEVEKSLLKRVSLSSGVQSTPQQYWGVRALISLDMFGPDAANASNTYKTSGYRAIAKLLTSIDKKKDSHNGSGVVPLIQESRLVRDGKANPSARPYGNISLPLGDL
jgi:hypothetical protein